MYEEIFLFSTRVLTVYTVNERAKLCKWPLLIEVLWIEVSKKSYLERGFPMFCLYVLVQILLESLPISSSTHTALLGLSAPQSIDFFAHGPTALMLLIYFRDEIYTFFSQKSLGWRPWILYGAKIFVAELVTCFFFLLFRYSGFTLSLWFGLLTTMFLLFSLKLAPHIVSRRVSRTVSWSALLAVAVVQGLSLLPGISRLASTLVIARWAGLEARTAFKLSCALQAPLFGAAALLGLWQISGLPEYQAVLSFSCLGGTVLAMIAAYLLLAFVERLYCREKLWIFGFYMIVPFVLSLFL